MLASAEFEPSNTHKHNQQLDGSTVPFDSVQRGHILGNNEDGLGTRDFMARMFVLTFMAQVK